MNLRRIDLNLLVIFDALIRERNVTRAARRVSLSQPAFSNALARLRHYLKDELFIRGPAGMLPTPRALELAPQIHSALAALETALDPQEFAPATATRSFTIDTNDYIVATSIALLMRRLEELAPGIDVRILPPAGKAFERLDAREVDFAVGTYGEIPERFGVLHIADNEFACMMRADHPLARGRLDLQRFAGARHLLITPRGDPTGFVDDALAVHKLTRRIGLTVNHFSVVPAVISNSDMIVTMPKRIAALYAPLYGLKLRPSPIAAPPTYAFIDLIWHKRLGQHPAYVWFREQLRSVTVAPIAAGHTRQSPRRK